ncbi:Putative cytochrome P450 superfamily protein [Zea mays]|uniref:Putative cytochrome P450 superfamily protein n=1 Tax=Zea mays TaxID=4577 RepID=A0A1D6G833_MAIZE|nr:Putative cytochrome P450 superfamily protein [Zea mays]
MQPQVAAVFFVSAACTVALAALLAVLRMRPPWWCACPVCEAYLTASWAGDFDNLCDWYAHLLRTSPAQTVHVHVLRNVLTANPATVDHMLRARFDNYPKGAPFSAILADFLGRGIFNVDGDAWLFQRKLAAAELASPALRAFAVRVVASELRGRLIPLLRSAACASGREGGGGGGGGRVLDLQDVFRRFAFDCICKISFGLDPGCLQLSMPVSSFEDAFDTASTLSARRATAPMHVVWKLKRLLNLGDERRLRDAVHLVDALAAEVIRQRRKLGGAASSGSDLLSRFMGSIDDDKYLRDIVVSFMLAGRDTVASALTAFFLLLSDHPEVAAAIRDEAARVAGDDDDGDGDDGRLTDSAFGKLKGMHYVHAALYESMRLFPPVQFDSKFAAGDDTLPDGTAAGIQGKMKWEKSRKWPTCLVQEPGPCGTRDGAVCCKARMYGGINRCRFLVVGSGWRRQEGTTGPCATRTAPQAFGGAPVIWSRRGAVLVPHVWGPPSRQPSHAHAPVEYHYQGQSQRARFVSRCRDEDPAPAVRKMLSRI